MLYIGNQKTIIMKKLTIILTVFCALVCNMALAQRDPATRDFIREATLANTKEIMAGQMAVRKGRMASVRNYGSMMVSDHTMAGDKLKRIARRKNFMVPMVKPAADPMLTRSMGNTFDRNYVTMMVADHKNAVALFERASRDVRDPDVRMFAANTLPTLRQHLMKIQQIARGMGIRY